MRDLHDPNNPDYQEEQDLTLELVLSTLTTEYAEVVETEISLHESKAVLLDKRMGLIKKELKELIEYCEQNDKTYIGNKLKTIVNY